MARDRRAAAAPARKPRSFAAMREDRVLDMAARRFGKPYTSRAAAVRDLSALPVAEQHKLPKRSDPGRPRRPAPYNNVMVLDAMRGGIARAPDALKLANATYDKPHSVMRLARASTNIKVTSPSQALTLLSRFGSTDMRKAATTAYSEIAHQHGGRIPSWPGGKIAGPKMPSRMPAPRAAAGGGALGTAVRVGLSAYAVYSVMQAGRAMASTPADAGAAQRRSVVSDTAVNLATAAAVVGATTAAVAALDRPREVVRGKPMGRGFDGRFTSRPPTRIARAVHGVDLGGIARATGAGLAVGAVVPALYAEFRERTNLGMVQSAGLAVAAPAAGVAAAAIAKGSLKAGLRLAGVAAVPALAVLGGLAGMREDRDQLRGFVRGAVKALDPTSLVMERGLGERAVDAVMGPPRKGTLQWEGWQGPKWKFDPLRPFRSGAYLNDGAARMASSIAPARATGVPVVLITAEPGRQPRQSYLTVDGRNVQATAAQIAVYQRQKAA